jgi:RTX calcium-binding nonapeptide repeat (4 copies)
LFWRWKAEIGGKELIKVRRILLTLVLGTLLAMLIAGGVALAADEPAPGKCSNVHNNLTGEDNALWCKGTDGPDTLIGAPTGDRLEGLGGKDAVYGLGGIDALYGGAGNDAVHGDAAPNNYNKEVGAANWDAIYGGNGADNLAGNAGIDVLYAGNDTSRDVLRGGADADVYVVNRAAYERGLTNPDARDADIIFEEESLGDGTTLPEGATVLDLHQQAVDAGHSLLYFYPE